MSRRKARELAMQSLYQHDIQGDLGALGPEAIWRQSRIDEDTREYTRALLDRYRKDPAAVDALIVEHLQNWNLKRMAVVDRNILRMAVCELLVGVTPTPVVIDEAIEIARKYSGSDSTEFVNGVLDAVSRHLPAGEDLEKA